MVGAGDPTRGDRSCVAGEGHASQADSTFGQFRGMERPEIIDTELQSPSPVADLERGSLWRYDLACELSHRPLELYLEDEVGTPKRELASRGGGIAADAEERRGIGGRVVDEHRQLVIDRPDTGIGPRLNELAEPVEDRFPREVGGFRGHRLLPVCCGRARTALGDALPPQRPGPLGERDHVGEWGIHGAKCSHRPDRLPDDRRPAAT